MQEEYTPEATASSPMQQWESIAKSDQFQQLPTEHRTAVRDRFFERSIQPSLPQEAMQSTRLRFTERTAADVAQPAGNEGKGFKAGLQSGWDGLQAAGGGVVMLAGDALGSESLSNAGLEIYDRNSKEAQESGLDYGFTDLFDSNRKDTSVAQWAAHTAGQLVPSI
jgi:hypothetical protein